MDDDKRLAFAQLVWTAHDKDFIGMLDAFVNMGLKLNREDPLTDMSNIRFMFRDTSPPDEARKDFQREIKKMEKNDERSSQLSPLFCSGCHQLWQTSSHWQYNCPCGAAPMPSPVWHSLATLDASPPPSTCCASLICNAC